jgi:tRNA modification GTPase
MGRFDLSIARGHTIHRCLLRDGNEDVDEILLAVYKAPKSYTGEDGAEIFCHGSLPVIQRILSLFARSGFRAAGPGEFTQRAFLNGRMGLTQAEAVNEIVRARTDRARGLALQRLGGAIEARIQKARDALIDLRASLELLIDFPDEQVETGVDVGKLNEAERVLRELLRTCRQGRMYQEGMSVAIVGATNAGKSSLFNALLRQDRAIVSGVHGTTRDWLEGIANIQGIPVRLFDTAGLRETTDPLEREGVRRTRELIDGADSVLYVVDGTRGALPADSEFLRAWERPAPLLRVWNKADLGAVQPAPDGFLLVSAVTGSGVDEVHNAIAQAALGEAPCDTSEPLVTSERQRELLLRALGGLMRLRGSLAQGAAPELLAVDCADTMDALGEITGAITNEQILHRMFSRFCVGK